MQLWLRIGDSDDYESFDQDLDALADTLREARVVGPLVRKGDVAGNEYHFTAANYQYQGQNYISLYWGDPRGTPEAALDDQELAQINTALDLDLPEL